jgi:quercetin dioxygenase-like cupin family protein
MPPPSRRHSQHNKPPRKPPKVVMEEMTVPSEPGIRYIISGELTFAEGGQETVYKAGEYFFETGNIVHTAQNKTNVPLRILVVEILPKDRTAPAMISPRSQ